MAQKVEIDFSEKSLKVLAALVYVATTAATTTDGKALNFFTAIAGRDRKKDDKTGKLVPQMSFASDISDYAKLLGLVDGLPEFVKTI